MGSDTHLKLIRLPERNLQDERIDAFEEALYQNGNDEYYLQIDSVLVVLINYFDNCNDRDAAKISDDLTDLRWVISKYFDAE